MTLVPETWEPMVARVIEDAMHAGRPVTVELDVNESTDIGDGIELTPQNTVKISDSEIIYRTSDNREVAIQTKQVRSLNIEYDNE